MKIARVDTFPVRLPRTRATGTAGSPTKLGRRAGSYYWSSTYPVVYSDLLETTLVRITTKDGIYGWGEAQAPVLPRVAATIIDDLLGPMLEGEDFDGSRATIERLWEELYLTMRVRGQTGGFMLDAISGIDLALWDLAGKIQQKPVSALIAGDRARTHVPAYLSGLSGATLEDRIAYARSHQEQGFTTFKLYFDSTAGSLMETVDAMPAGTQVAVDALWRLTLGDSLVAELAKRRLAWLECPFPPEQYGPHLELLDQHSFRLAVGESYRTRFELERFFEDELLTYVQPDLGRCGITETLRIAKRAEFAGVAVIPHVSIAMGPQIAAAIHVSAALRNSPMCEYNPSVFEASNRHLRRPLAMESASYVVPAGYGLGIDVELPSGIVTEATGARA